MRALILAGGTGTRFWPLSRRLRPKQLLPLDGERSLLRATFERLETAIEPAGVWVCTTDELAAAVRRELPEVPAEQVLSEPVGRNTAAAIGWSVRSMVERSGDGVVAVLPADHRVGDAAAFRAALERAASVAESGRVVALGITPRWAETGYGYLELGAALEVAGAAARRVLRFTEKPDADTARRFFESGRYLWNGGIFVFRGGVLLAHLARLEPELAAGLDRIAADPAALSAVYPRLPARSIDYAVMERLDDLATVPVDCAWSDLGSWPALAEIAEADEDGNVRRGEVIAEDCADSLFYADDGTIAAIGVTGLVVVRTADAVLVIPKERAQEVRRIVDALRAGGAERLL